MNHKVSYNSYLGSLKWENSNIIVTVIENFKLKCEVNLVLEIVLTVICIPADLSSQNSHNVN